MSEQSLLPGVERCIREARRLGLMVGLASSASRSWVSGYLDRLGIAAFFDTVKCADDVERTKPDPAVYVATLRALQVEEGEAIAFEDSPNGILTAKRAGLFCVAVPNAMTQHLVLDAADLRIPSLEALSLEELLQGETQGRR
jgi:HAD superfamily hydrolase (TIGR01509 family)